MYERGFPIRVERIWTEKFDKSRREIFQSVLAYQVRGPGAIPGRGGLNQLVDSVFYFSSMNLVQLLMFNRRRPLLRLRRLLTQRKNSAKPGEDAANKSIHR